MTAIRLALSLIVLLGLLPGAVSVRPTAETPLPLLNGDFEAGFTPVIIGGVSGAVGNHWTPFVITGTLAFQAGQVEPPPNHWQVLTADSGAYIAGIAQTVTGDLLPQDSLRASARVYPPSRVDGITKTLGLDPLGGSDPTASSVVWSSASSDNLWATLMVTATALTTQTTLFVKVEQAAGQRPGLVFVDDATLTRVRPSRTFLPYLGAALSAPNWQYQTTGIITGTTSCTSTGWQGRVTNADGTPRPDVRVRVWDAQTGEAAVTVSTAADGRWQALLDATAPRAGRWMVAVVDAADRPLSALVGQIGFLDSLSAVQAPGIPTSADCVNGHQWLTVNFQAQTTFLAYTLVSTRYLSCQDNHLNHNLRVWVIEADGSQRRGTLVRFSEHAGQFRQDVPTGADAFKPAGYIDYNLPGHQEFAIQVLAAPSDVTSFLSSMTPPVIETCTGNWWGHYSYEVIFQHRE